MKLSKSPDKPFVGMRLKSMISDMIGTIVFIDENDDMANYIVWDDGDICSATPYGNACECEIVEDGPLTKEELTKKQNILRNDFWCPKSFKNK